MALIWKAPDNIVELVNAVKHKHHMPRLVQAVVAVVLADVKPVINNRLNYGKVTKFSDFHKIWHGTRYDFCITLCSEVWHSVLGSTEREAVLDLHLTRCVGEYLPVMREIDGKTEPVKDQWGRIEYSDELKLDDEGKPKWKIAPLDLEIFADNARRYGLWCDELNRLNQVLQSKKEESTEETKDAHGDSTQDPE